MKPIYAKPPVGSRAAFQVRIDPLKSLDTKWHYHSEYELTYIHYPQGKQLVGNSINNFTNDDLVLFGPNLPHAWVHEGELPQNEDSYALVIHFTDDCLGKSFFSIPEMYNISLLLEKSKRGLSITGGARKKVAELMHQMNVKDGAERVILLLQVLNELAQSSEYSLLSSAGYWEVLNNYDVVRMNAIYEYIIDNFKKDIQLNDIAEQANMSAPAFCRYFKARTKKTFKEFVNDLRINYACKMLEENKISISQISFEAGYNNISNFNRRFKEIKKITPQQYKNELFNIYTKIIH